jgi:RNA polymerase sigma factor (TIGR02999 family)
MSKRTAESSDAPGEPMTDRDTRGAVGAHEHVDRMMADVYAELRRLAGRYVRREHAPTVQATELVHEAYLRLARDAPVRWENRAHFMALAAISMRRLLVERARARGAARRGGNKQVQVTLDDRLLASESGSLVDVIAVDRALTRLAAANPELARLVELRVFGGWSVEEAAGALGISPATVKRRWTMARAWLVRELEGSPEP